MKAGEGADFSRPAPPRGEDGFRSALPQATPLLANRPTADKFNQDVTGLLIAIVVESCPAPMGSDQTLRMVVVGQRVVLTSLGCSLGPSLPCYVPMAAGLTDARPGPERLGGAEVR